MIRQHKQVRHIVKNEAREVIDAGQEETMTVDVVEDSEAATDYGALLAGKVVMETWARLKVLRVSDGADPVLGKDFLETAQNFIAKWPQATDEALEIELKPYFDAWLGKGENPKAFSRLMAARLIRLMVQEFEREIEEQAQAQIEGRAAATRVVEADDVNYLPDDASELSQMGQRAAAGG